MIIPVITAFNLFAGPLPSVTADARANISFQESRYKESPQYVMIRGIITSTGTNAFAIGEHTMYIDAGKTGMYRQLGTIETGARAEVKAKRVNDVLYVEHIIIVGTGQGRTQVVVKAKEDDEKENQATVDADSRTRLEIKARGTFDQLSLYLKNVLKLFTSVSI